MRIIHCADIHLDSVLTTHLDSHRVRERRKELLDTFRRMLQYAWENDVDAVVIAGDLFDSETISRATVRILTGEICKYKNLEIYYLRGNHDPIHIDYDLPPNLHLFDDTWTYYILNDEPDNDIQEDGGRERNIVLAGVNLSENNMESIYDSLDLSEDDINIVTLHGQECDGTYGECDVNLRRLRNRGIDYLALGHVHKPKKAKLDERGVYVYPGCLEGRGFDECGSHGFVVLDIDEHIGRVESRFVSFAFRELHVVHIDISGAEDTIEAADIISGKMYENIDRPDDILDRDMVKVILEGEMDVETDIDIDYLTREFSGVFYYIKFVDNTRLRVDPLRYVHDVSLKGEFVRLVLEQDMTDEEKAWVIHTGIRALSGEEVWPE